MVALYIVLGFSLLVTLILFSNVSINISINRGYSLDLKFWFLKSQILSGGNIQPRKGKNSHDEPTLQNNKYIEESIKRQGLTATVTELLDILKLFFKEFGQLLNYLRVEKFKLFINVASDDPATTAVEYGAVCAMVYPAIRLIEEKTKFNHRGTKVIINSDFNSEQSEFIFDAKLKLRLIRLLITELDFLKLLVKIKIAEQNLLRENNSKQ